MRKFSLTPPRPAKPERAKWMSKTEVSALLYSAKAEDERVFLIFAMMWVFGLRVGEVRLLRFDDLDRVDGNGLIRAVRIPTLKKRLKKGEAIPRISTPVLAHFDWVKRAFDPTRLPAKQIESKYLFPSARNPTEPIKRRTIMDLWYRVRDNAGLNKLFSTHSLRHSVGRCLSTDVGDPILTARFLRQEAYSGAEGVSRATKTYIHYDDSTWVKIINKKTLRIDKLRPLPRGEVSIFDGLSSPSL